MPLSANDGLSGAYHRGFRAMTAEGYAAEQRHTMRHTTRLVIFSFVVLLGTRVQAQVKDMPSQAEFDPILENADNKLKDLLGTLTEFRPEATALNRDKLEQDLKDIQQVREMIQAAHSGEGRTKKGMNMARLVGILASFDDVTLDTAKWECLAEIGMCAELGQGAKSRRYDQFVTRIGMDLALLQEVGRELFHPMFRAASAVDEILLTLTDPAPGNNKQLR